MCRFKPFYGSFIPLMLVAASGGWFFSHFLYCEPRVLLSQESIGVRQSCRFGIPHSYLQFAHFYPLRFAAFHCMLLIAASGINAIQQAKIQYLFEANIAARLRQRISAIFLNAKVYKSPCAPNQAGGIGQISSKGQVRFWRW